MPHLSPMNWIFAMLMIWTLLFMISSSTWWSQPNSFKTPSVSKSASPTSSSLWKWL